MGDGHLGFGVAAKQRFKVLENNKKPTKSTLFRACPKSNMSKKVQKNKMLAQKVINHAQTQSNTQILLALEK